MPRKKKPIVEIVRASETALVPKQMADFRAMMDQIVHDRVEEALAERGEANFETREVIIELKRPRTVFDRKKWALYFEKWGCVMCGKKEVNHASLGRCVACSNLTDGRLYQIKIEYEREHPEEEIRKNIDHLTGRMRHAKRLLGEE